VREGYIQKFETEMHKAAEKNCIQRIVPKKLLDSWVAMKLEALCLSTRLRFFCNYATITMQKERIFETRMFSHDRVDCVKRENIGDTCLFFFGTNLIFVH